MPDEYREDLRRRLLAVYNALSATTYLAKIFDQDWYQTILDEIEKADLSRPFQCDSALMFFEPDHPLRGVPWFEDLQRKVEQGRAEELDKDERIALAFLGLDPLKTFLPVLEERLACFASSQFKQTEVSTKLNELRANRFNPSFRNHMFEISVLGFFCKEGVLTDIEVPVGVGASTVDGEINVDGRSILVEITFTSQELLSSRPGVGAVDVDRLVQQVVDKIRKKVAQGKQLAVARGNPSLLFLGRNRLGADKVAARFGIAECFTDPVFAALSGIVVSDSWKLIQTEFYIGSKPAVPLSSNEIEILKRWFGT